MIYSFIYLLRGTPKDELTKLVNDYENVQLPECEKCIDCMKAVWKNCSFGEKGQFHNQRDGELATDLYDCWSRAQ